MSRVGRKPIQIGENIKISQNQGIIHLEGPAGQLKVKIPENLKVEIKDSDITIIKDNSKTSIAMVGLFRSILANAVRGVREPWQKTLELVGVGFKAQTDGRELTLSLGFSHPVRISAIEGVSFQVVENKIIIKGCDKYLVGEMAARIRRIKPPEPYKGKGIRFEGEYIRRKLGKATKAVGVGGGK